jgi:UDP-N-acetyl-D-glucosamine dehydrogenase
MPRHVVNELARAIDTRTGKGLKGAEILLIGVAYKKNVEDTRESPALRLMEMLEQRGAHTAYYDPYVSVIPETREHKTLAGRPSQVWSAIDFAAYDAILITTDHDGIDYAEIAKRARLVVDTRNACRRAGIARANVIQA